METPPETGFNLSRRGFIGLAGKAFLGLALPLDLLNITPEFMKEHHPYDVIVVGGSYAGLAAAMALGRAMRSVLLIDSGLPCNRQTPFSHNFLTQDGTAPAKIAAIASAQVAAYPTVEFLTALATKVGKTATGFELQIATGQVFSASKLIFATGIKDTMPEIDGFAESWGKSALHCPYCHGYEVAHRATGILANGDEAFEMAKLISNWTKALTVFTNGKSMLKQEQSAILDRLGIRIVEKGLRKFVHTDGLIESIEFQDGSAAPIQVMYARLPFLQHCPLPAQLGCELTEPGYIQVDPFQKTSVHGVFACGDNSSRMRTVANAVATGTTAGMMVNKELIEESISMN